MKPNHTHSNLTMLGAGPVAITLVFSAALGLGLFDRSEPPLLPKEGDCSTMPPLAPTGAMLVADFTVTVGPGLIFKVNNVQSATLNLLRGQSYTFDLLAVSGAHPFVINSNAGNAGGTIYAGPASATTITFTPDATTPNTIYYHCQVHFTTMFGTINVSDPAPNLAVKTFLEGPYDPGTQTMSDALRAAGLVPILEPFTALGYTFTGGGGETTNAGVLAVTGSNAIVDWVVLELRDEFDPTAIVLSRAALLTRNGALREVNGVDNPALAIPDGNYHVAVRHRNHLAIMTDAPVSVSSTLSTVDFTLPTTTTFGINAMKNISGVMVMFAGDATFNGQVKYTGAGNDRDPVLAAIGGVIPTNTVGGQYLGTDVNLDAVVKYTGSNNDRDFILASIGGVIPTNTITQQLP